jgi:hypothetical protein
VTFAVAPWAKHSPLCPLQPPPNSFAGHLLSEEIRGWIPLGISPLGHHWARYLAGFSLTPVVLLRVGLGVCARRWKRRVRCSRWCRGEDLLG